MQHKADRAEATIMSSPDPEKGLRETLRSLAIVAGIAACFLIWGLTIFFTVGEKGPPAWDFGTVQDIPGESPYSTHPIKEVADLVPLPVDGKERIDGQHVDRPTREAGGLERKDRDD
jgi:hypothetical protein